MGGYILGFQLGEQSGEHDAHTQEYARHAAEEIEATCLGRGRAFEAECIARIIEAANEDKRAQSDLNAQRNMARWALLMLFATVAMAITTGWGVYYVWRTLGVTREVGQAQARAHLHFEIVDVNIDAIEIDGVEHVRANFKGNICNTGNSPAHRINILFDIFQSNVGEVVAVNTDGSELPNSQKSMSAIPSGGDVTVELKRTFPADLLAFRETRAHVGLSYVIKCVDVFQIEVYEPMVSGVFKEHPVGSGSYVFAQSIIASNE